MICQCAWCRRRTGHVPPLDDTRVTHGICPACEAAHFPGLRAGGVPDGRPTRTSGPADSPRPLTATVGD
jgi:hypothetical protein